MKIKNCSMYHLKKGERHTRDFPVPPRKPAPKSFPSLSAFMLCFLGIVIVRNKCDQWNWLQTFLILCNTAHLSGRVGNQQYLIGFMKRRNNPWQVLTFQFLFISCSEERFCISNIRSEIVHVISVTSEVWTDVLHGWSLLFLPFTHGQKVLMTHFRYVGMSKAYTKGLAAELKDDNQTPGRWNVYLRLKLCNLLPLSIFAVTNVLDIFLKCSTSFRLYLRFHDC